jgi:hypothetical protein
MKAVASLVILAASACTAFQANPQPSSAAISRREIFDGVASAAVAAALVARPSSSIANDLLLPPINGIYSDPNHRNGYRVVRVVDKSNAVITLQDEMGGPVITVPGKIKTTKREGTTIALDLSRKGGPKNVVAKLAAGSNRLSFPDGNSWTKIPGVDGIYADPNHPSGYRVVREGQGGKVYITLQDEPKGKIVELEGYKRVGGGYISIDFSPKGGPKDLAAVAKVGKLVFPDGNAWTKL